MLSKILGGTSAAFAAIIYFLLAALSGFSVILTLIFVCAKLFALVSWPWLTVFMPLIIVGAGWVALGILAIIAVLLLS